MSKVAHLTSVHIPTDTRIFHRECVSLAEAGYEVMLIAPAEQDQMLNGVYTKAVPKPANRWQRISKTAWQVYRAALAEKAAIYHFHDPELLPIGVLLKRKTGAKVVYDAHEDLPLTIAWKHWMPSFLRPTIARLAGWTEKTLARELDTVVTVTPSIAAKFNRRRTVIVQNYALPEELSQLTALPYQERPPLFAYVGRIATQRGAIEIVDAMALLETCYKAQLTLAGKIVPDALEETLRQRPGWQSVRFLGWQVREGVRDLLAHARIGLVTLHPTEQYTSAQPVKLFEYMAAGIPVIASDFPLWREIVAGANCGLLIDPRSSQEIAAAMRWLLDNPAEAEAMGQRGRAAMLQKYNWKSERAKLLAMYAKLLGERIRR